MRYCQERAEYVNANVPIRNQFDPLECAVRKEVWQLVVVAQDLFVMLSNLYTYFMINCENDQMQKFFTCIILFATLDVYEKNEFVNMLYDTLSIYRCAVNIQNFLTYVSSDDVRQKEDA